jgi:hypothetical protein
MKKVVIIFSVISLVALNSCNQKTDSKAILENSKSRTEIFDGIANNHEFMTEFMEKMQGNSPAIQMMHGNKLMMGNMMDGKGMQMMMKDSMMTKNFTSGMMTNPQMMQSMMGEMMKDGKTMAAMMQMMQQGGMMSKECMQSSMKMMDSKGMGMMNAPTKK